MVAGVVTNAEVESQMRVLEAQMHSVCVADVAAAVLELNSGRIIRLSMDALWCGGFCY